MYFPGGDIKVVCHILLQSLFPTQETNPCLLHWQADSLPLSHQASPNPPLEQSPLAFQKLFYHNLSEALEQVALISRFIQSSLVTQMVKNSPATQENWVWNLGHEDPLKKEMTTHCSVLAWRIPWQRGLEGSSPCSHKLLNMTQWISTCTCINLYSGCCVL